LFVINDQCLFVYIYEQQQYKDVQSSSMRTNTTVIPVHDDDEGNTQSSIKNQ